LISYEKRSGHCNKLHNYLKITGIISNTIRPQVTFKKKRIKLDTTTALSTLLYSSDNWTTVAQARRITAAEIKYMRKKARYNWTDYKTDTATTKDLNVTSVWTKERNTEDTGCNNLKKW
jgi:hypothetical protein